MILKWFQSPLFLLVSHLLSHSTRAEFIIIIIIIVYYYMQDIYNNMWARVAQSVSDSLLAGRSGDRVPVGARFSAAVQEGPGAHPASYKMGTGSLSCG